MQLPKKAVFKKYMKYFLFLIFSPILLGGLFFGSVYLGVFGPLPDKAELAAIRNEEASQVISSDSVIVGKFFAENRTNIAWGDVPEQLKNALIATEDKRFFTHKGYDLQSYVRVFFRSILFRDSKGGGGSTLTQQLVKNLFGRKDYSILSMPVNKTKELIIAARMEELYTKEELLLLYLNSVSFGEDVFGVESAAHRYFNKSTRELKTEESAVLIGLLKANTYFNPRLNPQHSLGRRNTVLVLMEKQQYLSVEEADSLKNLPLNLNYENIQVENPAGYFVYQVRKNTLDILDDIKIKTGKDFNIEKDGLKIYTTLNMQMQAMATESIRKQLSVMQKVLDKELQNRNFKKRWYAKQKSRASGSDLKNREVEVFNWEGKQARNMNKIDSLWHYYKMLHAAVLITNPKNGTVLSWVGGNDYRTLPFDMVLSHRQIASAFKPILYATAMDENFDACTYLKNEEKKYTEYDGWEPQNFDRKSTKDSTVAMWYALANSINLPTVDLYFKLGREKLINATNRLQFPHFTTDGPSVSLGALDLSLFEIVRAYGSFANSGKMTGPVMIDKITDADGTTLYERAAAKPEQVFKEETAKLITAVLQRAIDQGTGTKIRTQYGIRADLAGKTGTAQDYTDAWFVAYTPDLVIGTWAGASTPDVHFYSSNGSGSSLALPIAGRVLRGIEKDPVLRKKHLTPFNLPAGVYAGLDCQPYRETGIKGFFKRLFRKKERN